MRFAHWSAMCDVRSQADALNLFWNSRNSATAWIWHWDVRVSLVTSLLLDTLSEGDFLGEHYWFGNRTMDSIWKEIDLQPRFGRLGHYLPGNCARVGRHALCDSELAQVLRFETAAAS